MKYEDGLSAQYSEKYSHRLEQKLDHGFTCVPAMNQYYNSTMTN